MVFERLGPSLYDFLRRNAYRPFPLAMVGAGCSFIHYFACCTSTLDSAACCFVAFVCWYTYRPFPAGHGVFLPFIAGIFARGR